MAFADVQAKTNFTGFTAAQQTTILNAMEAAYNGSATAKAMFDDWIATAGNTIDIKFVAGAFRAFLNTGRVEIDLAFLDNASYISPTGKAVEDTLTTGLLHELGHALGGKRDNWSNTDYKGDNVKFVNPMFDELGIPEQLSYIAYDSSGNIHKLDFEYTGGTAIDAAESGDRNWNSSPLGDSKDLLIGGPGGNTLQSGPGNDFLLGAGGDDNLNGGDGKDTVVYFGDPLDYDIRLQPDMATWTVRHVRGDKDAGEDTVTNTEVIRFEDGETFDLKKKGLTFQKDFALVIDTTGSMGPHIDGVKAQAIAITDALFDGSTDARIGVVGYKDETNGEPPSIILPFTDHDEFADRKAAAINAINGITVGGGGDLPETYYGGLLAALDGRLGDWRPGAGALRIAAFTDAAAKDGHLFAQVAALAADIGVSFSRTSSVTGVMSAIDTFEFDFGSADSSAAARDLLSEGDPIPPFEPADDPAEPVTGTATLEIYSIFTGPTGVDTSDLESIADETGGTFLTATTPEELVTTLIDIIEAPSGLVGTPGPDVLVGGPEDDIITGLAGNDRLAGNRGDDSIEGNRGDDFLFGRLGNDELFGGKDHDVVRGGWGSDLVAGGLGHDRLYGGPGDDLVLGGPGNDVARGGPGNDEMRGGAGHDTLRGGFDDDRLLGGRGADELFGFVGDDELRGGPDNDVLRGGFGADLVAGGRGDDLLFGGPGSDRLFGAPGSDTFIFGDSDDLGIGPDRDVAVDFLPGTDVLNLSHIDADTTVDGDQAFSFIGAAAFSSAGELRYAGDILSGDVNGDGVADFEIAFANSALLTSDDMLL